jgi:ABC-type polar amino acid transport system ATPase subunit
MRPSIVAESTQYGISDVITVEPLMTVGLRHRAMACHEQISCGEQRRVAIVRALALKPAVLRCDEPISSMDPESAGDVPRVMRGLAKQHMRMIRETHEPPFAREVLHASLTT